MTAGGTSGILPLSAGEARLPASPVPPRPDAPGHPSRGGCGRPGAAACAPGTGQGNAQQEKRTMTQTQPAARPLPPVAAPKEVADSGLIRLGAAVGGPVKR